MRAKDIDPENGTILAAWRYGAGKTVAFTSDAGTPLDELPGLASEEYDKFFSQMIRYAMRPVNEEGKFNVATDVKDGQVRVVVTALDKNDEFLNFLNMSRRGHRAGDEHDRRAVSSGRPRPLRRRVSGRQGRQLSAGRQHGPERTPRRCWPA